MKGIACLVLENCKRKHGQVGKFRVILCEIDKMCNLLKRGVSVESGVNVEVTHPVLCNKSMVLVSRTWSFEGSCLVVAAGTSFSGDSPSYSQTFLLEQQSSSPRKDPVLSSTRGQTVRFFCAQCSDDRVRYL